MDCRGCPRKRWRKPVRRSDTAGRPTASRCRRTAPDAIGTAPATAGGEAHGGSGGPRALAVPGIAKRSRRPSPSRPAPTGPRSDPPAPAPLRPRALPSGIPEPRCRPVPAATGAPWPSRLANETGSQVVPPWNRLRSRFDSAGEKRRTEKRRTEKRPRRSWPGSTKRGTPPPEEEWTWSGQGPPQARSGRHRSTGSGPSRH